MSSRTALSDTIFNSFGVLEDPRAANTIHPMDTILFLLIVGVLCGADGFVHIERIARLKIDSTTLRGVKYKHSENKTHAEDHVHRVSAFSQTRQVVLAHLRLAAVVKELHAARAKGLPCWICKGRS